MNAKTRHRRRYRTAHAKPCPNRRLMILREGEREQGLLEGLGFGRARAAIMAASLIRERYPHDFKEAG